MTVIRAADARRTETPGGVMTTFASPTQGAAGRSLWRVEAKPGVAGPLHDFDVEQVWSWLDGTATVELGEESFAVAAGDTVVMPARTPRRVTAGPDAGYTAVVTARAGARAMSADGADLGTPPWIA
ncbi:cupin domain-containing protein [Nonomuraea wenchangensis]|uniref:Mannose-6-phosphate isomerase, cupin superfamily n=1 Tax=Nonomuraea wenchangensis TaxID=568860 RepID=A0A1I0HJA8_9ACTN|nr:MULTISPECIES: cupin [Nonomuraea]MED7928940.1 cupin [Nonomuraea sp. LP-02]SET84034.1 Mannose-6-phosphate isomerase, cupin superfamily [Nonomuraea wenchangensis]